MFRSLGKIRSDSLFASMMVNPTQKQSASSTAFHDDPIKALKSMKNKMDAISKTMDEDAAYKLVDRGDKWDLVRSKMREGYEISHLEVSRHLYDLINEKAYRHSYGGVEDYLYDKASPLMNGVSIKLNEDITGTDIKFCYVKSVSRVY